MNTFIFLATVLAVGLPFGSLAQEPEPCYTNATAAAQMSSLSFDTDGILLTVSSQAELDEAIAGCSTLVGNIQLSAAFAGPFTLNGVVNVTGEIYMEYTTLGGYTSLYEYVGSHENITSFEMLDVVYLQDLYLLDVPDIRLPKVEYMRGFSLRTSSGGSVDLGALREVSSFHTEGPSLSVNLQSLEIVTESILVCSQVNCKFDDPSSGHTLPTPVDLPALEYARRMEFNGTFSNFSMPKLRTIGSTGYPLDWSGFSLFLRDEEMPPLDFAPLETLYGHLIVFGDVSDIRLSPIKSTTAWIHIETTVRAEIYSSLEEAGDIDIRGQIASVDVPNLTEVGEFSMSSTEDIPCTASLRKIYNQIIETSIWPPSWCNDPEDASFDEDGGTFFKPDSHTDSSSDDEQLKIATGGLVGCAVGGVAVFLLIVGFIWRRHVKNKRERNRNVSTSGNGNNNEDEDQDLPAIGNDGPPPPYSKDPPVALASGR
ncbi:hypothetical protein BDV18DRAFT_134528 [Aspergillus unguis]